MERGCAAGLTMGCSTGGRALTEVEGSLSGVSGVARGFSPVPQAEGLKPLGYREWEREPVWRV